MRFFISAALGALCGLFVHSANGQLIDFETTPAGGVPTDNAFLNAPYPLSGGGSVLFFFDVNGNDTFDGPLTDELPVFEAAGNGEAGPGFFNAVTGIEDTASGGLGAQLGSFFLRQRQPGAPPPAFIVDYNTLAPINALRGEIWDIDGTTTENEQWLVEILDAANVPMTSQLSILGDDLSEDGLPWQFVFSGLAPGADKVRITFVGSKTMGLGLAFNNFDPFNVPEPATALLLMPAVLLARRARLD